MSAPVSARPTGPQPRLGTAPSGEHPYPAAAVPAVPTFTPSPALGDASREATGYTLESMRARGWAPVPAEAEPRYETVGRLVEAKQAARRLPPLPVRVPGATLRPAAAPAPAPEPPAAEPFPAWLRDFLLVMLDDAAYGVGAALDRPCRLDQHAASGWCENCQDLYDRAGRYARLQEALLATADSGAAVRTLLAEGWR